MENIRISPINPNRGVFKILPCENESEFVWDYLKDKVGDILQGVGFHKEYEFASFFKDNVNPKTNFLEINMVKLLEFEPFSIQDKRIRFVKFYKKDLKKKVEYLSTKPEIAKFIHNYFINNYILQLSEIRAIGIFETLEGAGIMPKFGGRPIKGKGKRDKQFNHRASESEISYITSVVQKYNEKHNGNLSTMDFVLRAVQEKAKREKIKVGLKQNELFRS